MNILYASIRPIAAASASPAGCRIESPEDAIAAGIGIRHQHLMLVEPFTVLKNLLLGAEGQVARSRQARRGACRDRANSEPRICPRDRSRCGGDDLPVGPSHGVKKILRRCFAAKGAGPGRATGVLTPQEADHLFRILRKPAPTRPHSRAHHPQLREIMAATDNAVMRQGSDGRRTGAPPDLDRGAARLMVGRRSCSGSRRAPRAQASQSSRWRASVVPANGAERHPVKGVSFAVRGGEIVGIAGSPATVSRKTAGGAERHPAFAEAASRSRAAARPREPRPHRRSRACAGEPAPHGSDPRLSRPTRTRSSDIRSIQCSARHGFLEKRR